MKINAFFIEDTAFIDGHLISPSLNLDETIRFLIDTGASHTTILDKDAIRLGIDYLLSIAITKTSVVSGEALKPL